MDKLTDIQLYEIDKDDLIDYIVELRVRLQEVNFKLYKTEQKLNDRY